MVEKFLDEEFRHQGCFILPDAGIAVKAEVVALQRKQLLTDHIVQIGGLWIGAFFQKGHAEFIIAAEFGDRDNPGADPGYWRIQGRLFPAAAGSEEKDEEEKRHRGCCRWCPGGAAMQLPSRRETAAGGRIIAVPVHLISTIFPVLIKAPASRRKK